MSDRRRHRGRHPADAELFAVDQRATLLTAVGELSWLLERGYSDTSAIRLVGDRHGLRKRQRLAMRRCACAESAALARRVRRAEVGGLRGRLLAIDGFNCLITLEAALSGGLVMVGRDRVLRDLASVHGSYRRVDETRAAIVMVGELSAEHEVASLRWYLDRPVSNSGRLAALLRSVADEREWSWSVELVDNPDRVLVAQHDADVVVSSDSWVIDNCGEWADLPAAIIAERIAEAWIVDLSALDPARIVPAQ